MRDLSDKDKLIMYEAITDYALDLKEPDLEGFPKVVFDLIRPVLETNIKRWQNGCKGGEYGTKGGAPKGNQNAKKRNNPKTTANQPQNNPDITPKANNDSKSSSRFIKPSIQEVKDYILSSSYSVDAERFYNYYEANGWKVGRNAMKDWKAAVRTWQRQSPQGKSTDIGVILKDNNPDKYNEKLW